MIGVYDSGVGGLSVWQELYRIMPEEDYIYIADTLYCPYGNKPRERIVERADKITRYLLQQGADLMVVACNTATAAAITYLRETFDIPFVGMEPAIKPAASRSRSGVVGVLATANTFKGSLYKETMHRYASHVKVVETEGKGLVEAVEKGELPEALLQKYIGDMKAAGADVIVLGCTHFPFLQDRIAEIAGPSVQIINPAPAVARQVRRVKETLPVREPGHRLRFLSTGDVESLSRRVRSILPSVSDDSFAVLKNI